MNIFLIGLPGSGKSTLGKELAEQLTLKMVDTDAEIVKAEGKSIEAIFKDSGEAYFRKLEQAILHKFSKGDKQLISTGGGMPCFFDNMEFMNKNGITVFIDVPVENLHKRLLGQKGQKRPMIEGKTNEEVLSFLREKYEERFPYYSKATLTVRGANIKLPEIIFELKKWM